MILRKSKASVRVLVAAALNIASGYLAVAQTPFTPTLQVPNSNQAQAAPVIDGPSAVVSSETKAVRAKLDGYKAELDQKELTLQGRALSDVELKRLRDQLEPLALNINQVIDQQTPRLEASRARLNQLGPKPKEGQPEESPDVARDRIERESAVAELGETQRLARALLVQADQLDTQISDLLRAAFAKSLFEQSDGILSPTLWLEVAHAVPHELRAQRLTLSDTIAHIQRTATIGALLFVGLALGISIAFYNSRRFITHRVIRRDKTIIDPSRRSRYLAALGVLVFGAVPAAAGSWIIWIALHSTGIVQPRMELVIASLLRGLAFLAFVRALAEAILASDQSSWRLVPIADASAARVMNFVVTVTSVITAGRVLEAFNQAVAAVLPVTILTRAIFALASALIFALFLRSFATNEDQEERNFETYPSTAVHLGGPIRSLGWVIATVIILSVFSGYIALASFLVDQVVLISILVAMLIVTIALTDEFIGNTLRTRSRIATILQANTGLHRRSLEQIGLLASGMLRLALILAAVMLALAQWGVESTDLMGAVRAAFFGFTVGNITISLSAILIAALFFAIGFTITRLIQRWLDNTFLPSTDLDAGLRNSIRTATGYIGVIATGMAAFTYLGLSLERLTIVAGALSVGIGFGLQSIVNNFISGLILLWERPIRVGDLVVVGDGEGYVRRINVRSTEIQTGDRSTLIVPNSNLISGVVRNRMRNDRIGRVLVSILVPRTANPDYIAQMMRQAALAHREVMSEPNPSVLFKKVTENTLDFDLICFVDNIDSASRVASDLYFSIFRSFRETGIGELPVPSTKT